MMKRIDSIVFSICLLVLFTTHHEARAEINITLSRDVLELRETEYEITEFNLTGDLQPGLAYTLSITIDDARIAEVTENATLDLPPDVVSGGFETRGKRLGLGILTFDLYPTGQQPGGENSTEVLTGYEVIVLRQSTTEEEIFEIGLITFAVILYIGYGSLIDLDVVWKVIKKPVGPAIGFMSQFVIMPLLGFGLAEALGLDKVYAFGLLTMACSPGGGSSNVYVILFGGDLDLSLTMTSISTICSLMMMPAWLYLLGTQYIDIWRVQIPYSDIAMSLLYIIIPCCVGIALRKFAPKVADKVAKAIRPFSAFFVLFIIAFGLYVNWYIIDLIGDELLIIPAAFLLPFLGYLCGFLAAILLGRSRKVAVTIAIETGVQNPSIPILVLQRSFSQPEGDLGAVMPLTTAYLYSIPIFTALGVLALYKKCTGKDPMAEEPSKVAVEESEEGQRNKDKMEDKAMANGGFVNDTKF